MAGDRPLYSSNWVDTAKMYHVRKIVLNVCAGRSKRGRRLFAATSLPLATYQLCTVSAQTVDRALILVQGSNFVARSYVINTIISVSIRQSSVPCQPLCCTILAH
ncbi:hypothetical protein Mapa_011348 [Marchantia paleacea]|nr:hypothetical protein Mapa_011348 [Marchantia paleacea]